MLEKGTRRLYLGKLTLGDKWQKESLVLRTRPVLIKRVTELMFVIAHGSGDVILSCSWVEILTLDPPRLRSCIRSSIRNDRTASVSNRILNDRNLMHVVS